MQVSTIKLVSYFFSQNISKHLQEKGITNMVFTKFHRRDEGGGGGSWGGGEGGGEGGINR